MWNRIYYRKCFLLILLVIFIYFFSNLSIDYIVKYILGIVLWSLLFLLIYLSPRVKIYGKLRCSSSINFWSFNFAVIFILISIVGGLVDGFGKSPYSHSFKGLFLNVLNIGFMIVSKEAFRSFIINNLSRKEKYYRTIFLVSLFMAFIEMPLNRYVNLIGYKNIIQFTAEHFLPNFFKNLMASYISFLGGAASSVIYMGTIQSFHWLSPILPNLRWITTSLVGILCPLLSLDGLRYLYEKETCRFKGRQEKGSSILNLVLTSSVAILVVWFAAGVLPIYPSVIATGSMKPAICPGDITINREVDIDKLKIGDVIQFKKDNIFVSHRITEVVYKDSKIYFRTKGDNNSSADSKLVPAEAIKGKVMNVVPTLGWITLIARNKSNISLDEIEF